MKFRGISAESYGRPDVAADAMPFFGEARVPVQRYVQSTEIAPLVLPAATEGNSPLACTLVAMQEPTRTLTPYGARFVLDRRSSWV